MTDVMMQNWKSPEERNERTRKMRRAAVKNKSADKRATNKPQAGRGSGARPVSEPINWRDYLPLMVRALVVLLMLGGAGAAYAWLQHQQWEDFKIRSIEITGAQEFVTSETVSEALQQYAQGDFFDMEIEAAREALLALPWVREVSLRREWPDRLIIKLQEQQAVARWGDVSESTIGVSALLNEQGQHFAGLNDMDATALPVLRGPEGSQVRVLKEYSALNQSLSSSSLAINTLQLDARDTWHVELSNGLSVLFLERNKVDALQRLATALNVFDADKLKQANTIDLRYSNGFAIEWSETVEMNATGNTGESASHV